MKRKLYVNALRERNSCRRSFIFFAALFVGFSGIFCRPIGLPVTHRIKYAKGFYIRHLAGYKELGLIIRQGVHYDTIKFALYRKGEKAPALFPSSRCIETPVKSLVCMSSMHVALAEQLEADDLITGLGSFKYVSSSRVRARIDKGLIKEVGIEGNINEELLIAMRPGAIMLMRNPTQKNGVYKNLVARCIPLLVNSEWLEEHPLARAEWIKVMAALLDKEELAQKIFDASEREYIRLSRLSANVKTRPLVLTGLPFKGVWYVPDSDSYVAQFLRDAAAINPWSRRSAKTLGSLPLGFEQVFQTGGRADFWIQPGQTRNKAEILASDVRFGKMKAFIDGNVYNNNKRISSQGSNDYWETGAVHPEDILADLIEIFHPELLPGRELIYYKKLN